MSKAQYEEMVRRHNASMNKMILNSKLKCMAEDYGWDDIPDIDVENRITNVQEKKEEHAEEICSHNWKEYLGLNIRPGEGDTMFCTKCGAERKKSPYETKYKPKHFR